MDSKHLLLNLLLVFFSLQSVRVNAQNYRNAQAYIDDFEKNESYVNEYLIEYSSSIIYRYKDARTQATLERIYEKLEAINNNLYKNDIGFQGDMSLRDSFLKMNTYTITLLENSSLRLTDYDLQKTQAFSEIFECFDKRKQDIINYYSLILDYNNCKRNFSKRNNLKNVRYFVKKNLFEYDAHQSLFFFKMNVLDAKLCDLLKTTDTKNTTECALYLNQVCEEVLIETEQYKKVHIDHSLNNANIGLIQFLTMQNESLIPKYINYMQALKEFKVVKANSDTSIELYNEKVRILNRTKNIFYDNFNEIQTEKKELIEKWYKIKSNFLKKNL
ncbi:MAG: hypothetical protein KAX93_06350 [Flavobacterium sp.]|nr:hypothetical protein [Flavobacterium sp.]